MCFHAQQCVEKYIKALLIVHEIDFPKTHDIERLIQLLPPNISLPIAVPDQALLTTYAVTARYPGDDEPVSRADARHAMTVIRKTRKAENGFDGMTGKCYMLRTRPSLGFKTILDSAIQ
ncbi:MAG: HEPN domain-containing protein [Pseudomonadota bacterium]